MIGEVGNRAEAVAEAEAAAEAGAEAKQKQTGQTGSINAANFRLGDWAKRLIKCGELGYLYLAPIAYQLPSPLRCT